MTAPSEPEYAGSASRNGEPSDETLAVTVAAACLWAGILYVSHPGLVPVGRDGSFHRMEFATLFLGGVLAFYAIDSCRRAYAAGDHREARAMAVAAGVALLGSLYVYRNQIELAFGAELPLSATVAAVALLGLVWYFAWRELGPVPAGLVGLALAYALLGAGLPEPLGHEGLAVEQLALTVAIDGGVHGQFVQTTGLQIALLVLYAALVVGYGGVETLRSIAAAASSRLGSVRRWAIGSALLASVSGSYLANADLLRSRSVPALSELGLSDRDAAGVEAAASTIGQVLPPTIFIAGFLVASLVSDLTLTDVVVAGLLPAAIAVSCFLVALRYVPFGADRRAATTDSSRSDDGADTSRNAGAGAGVDSSRTRRVLAIDGVRFGLPLVAFAGLYYGNVTLSLTLTQALVWTVLLLAALGLLVPVVRSAIREPAVDGRHRRPIAALEDAVGDTAHGLRLGALVLAPVVIAVAAIGVVVDLLLAVEALELLSTVGTTLEDWPLAVVGLALVVAAVGTAGLPTAVGAALVGTLAVFGAGSPSDLSAFFATLYAAVAVGVAPPVAAAAARTARVGSTDTRSVSLTAMRLLAPVYVLPFAIVSHPELVSPSPSLESLTTAAVVLVGALAVVYAANAPIQNSQSRRSRWFVRTVAGALGVVAMAYPTTAIQFVAAAVILGLATVRLR
ncbi:TRAP transporter large permease subunit [Natronorubrum texcoconense]|uniref:TRAP transporter large permease subunit n=1 Tax=Natronorubrum texcoconense TaxID=1095776 RepID=UPI00158753C7|nr:TRAP transporter large permease subunit [Natronorubrum texcoconense]